MTTTITKTLSGQWIEFEVERTSEGIRIVKETLLEGHTMATALYYTVFIVNGTYPNARSTEVLGTYSSREAYTKANELKAQGHKVAVNYQ